MLSAEGSEIRFRLAARRVTRWLAGFLSLFVLIWLIALAGSAISPAMAAITDVPQATPTAGREPDTAAGSGSATNQGGSPPNSASAYEGTSYSDVDWSSNAFSMMMWLAGIGVGVVAFLLFLFLNRWLRSSRDWLWPFLPVVFLGYVIVFSPTWVSSEVYENWSAQCLNSEAAPATRTPQEDTSDAACQRAQLGHHALGYHAVISAYRSNILNGSEEMLMPGELKRLAWLLLVIWAAAGYLMLLTVRNQFVAH